MARVLVAVLAILLVAPAAGAGERPREGSPDLHAQPPDEDPLLVMLASDPDLRARAESGRNLV